MAHSVKGTPCWYELASTDPEAAQLFYAQILGWAFADSGMPGFDYRLASSADGLVAGLMSPPPAAPASAWMVYFAVTDCDKAARAIARTGGKLAQAPADLPGTGRFAIAADPQGARFGILAPLDGTTGGAFDPQKPGHGRWHDLMTSDPKAAMTFYGKLFGWKPGTSLAMGANTRYDLFCHRKTDIGGMMRQAPGMPGPGHPFWLPYFGTDSTGAALGRVTSAGGRVLHGPVEVPGGAFILLCQDPQGAFFALAGPE